MYYVRCNQKPVKACENSTKLTLRKDKTNFSCQKVTTTCKFEQPQAQTSELKFSQRIDPFVKATKDSRTFLRTELRKYGLHPRKIPTTEMVHYNSPSWTVNTCLTQRKTNTKTTSESQTEPNLISSKYIEDLKNEIKLHAKNLPTLPEKYKDKYIKSLKEEVLLNKVSTNHENDPTVSYLHKEIDEFRATKVSPLYSCPPCPPSSKHRKVMENRGGNTSRTSSDKGSMNDERKTKSKKKKTYKNEKRGFKQLGSSSKSPKASSSRAVSPLKFEETVTSSSKQSTTISTQYEIQTSHNQKFNLDKETLKKLDAVQEFLPAISSIIHSSEKKLTETFERVLKPPRSYQERGVSPVKEFLNQSPLKEEEKDEQTQLSQTPKVGDLMVNIENIKDTRCLLEGFQHELFQIRKDIRECLSCNLLEREDETHEKFCGKHSIYVPLLKLEDLGSKSEKIRLFNTLKTEALLKKEMENQVRVISELERKLSALRKDEKLDDVKAIETALEFSKSYLNNLAVKQETERLLNEQQDKMERKQCSQRCLEENNCDRCHFDVQIHDLLEKVRECITKDLNEAKQRLKVQKMPSIEIKKPLQLQNTLVLNIPPSNNQADQAKINVLCETIQEKNGVRNRKVQTNLMTDEHRETGKKTTDTLMDLCQPLFSGKLEYAGIIHEEIAKTQKYVQEVEPRGVKLFSKSPSELGFSRTIAIQCDSDMQLNEKIENSVQTVTSFPSDDNSYLFGFREYLMKKSQDSSCGDEKIDVNLQVNMDESNLSAVITKPSRSKDVKPTSDKEPDHLISYIESEEEDTSSTDSDEPHFEYAKTYRSEEKIPPTRHSSTLTSEPARKESYRKPSIEAAPLVKIEPASSETVHPRKISSQPAAQGVSNRSQTTPELIRAALSRTHQARLSRNHHAPENTQDTTPEHPATPNTTPENMQSTPEKIQSSPEITRAASEIIKTIPEEVIQSTTPSAEEEMEVTHEVIREKSEEVQISHDEIEITPEPIHSPPEEVHAPHDEIQTLHEEVQTPLEENQSPREEAQTSREEILQIPRIQIHIPPEELAQTSPDEESQTPPSDESVATPNPSQSPRTEDEETRAHQELELSSQKSIVNIHSTSKYKILKFSFNGHEGDDEDKDEGGMFYKSLANKEEKHEKKSREDIVEKTHGTVSHHEAVVIPEEPVKDENRNDETFSILIAETDDTQSEYPFDGTSFDKSLVRKPKSADTVHNINDLKTSDEHIEVKADSKEIETPLSKSTSSQPSDKKITIGVKYFEHLDNSEDSSTGSEKNKAVYTVFPPTYRININRNKSLDRSLRRNYPLNSTVKLTTSKKLETYIDLDDSFEDSFAKSPCLLNLDRERIYYSNKCAARLADSSKSPLVPSEGEVSCQCTDVSLGEFHDCTRKRSQIPETCHVGITHKDKLSSHLVLEKERKHYNHWVTYYSVKKKKENAGTSSLETKENDQVTRK